jgi:hypothetical protein
MAKKMQNKINAKGLEITVITDVNQNDYISLTDLAKYKNMDAPNIVIQNWLRRRSTIEYLGLWEIMNNKKFKPLEFEGFKNEAGANAFTLSPKQWINKTNAIGIRSAAGRYGGTFAHADIAMEFMTWLSPEFKLYVIKDYQRLKHSESYKNKIEWNIRRELAKTNYSIHTAAIKENLIPSELTDEQKRFKYADEADILNIALFGKTAKQFKKEHPDLDGNQRDNASIEQNIIMANLESLNAVLIYQKFSQSDRLKILRDMAIKQLEAIMNKKSVEKIKQISDNENAFKLK